MDILADKQVTMTRKRSSKNKLLLLYHDLLKRYGSPGKWPWFNQDVPHSRDEIVIGTILTQNTNWRNVQKAIENLRKNKASRIKEIYKLGKSNTDLLKQLIKPSGFYNQKSERLILLSKFIVEKYTSLEKLKEKSTREIRSQLLDIKGIGKETADTILLYALDKPIFIIDSYTRRFAKKSKLSKKLDYDSLQAYFMKSLPKNTPLYQAYHALIVQWGKSHNKKDFE